MVINQVENNFIDIIINWIKQNNQNSNLFDFVNKINKKIQNDNIVWYNPEKNKILIEYNYKENKYKCIISKKFYSKNLSTYDFIVNSDYSDILIDENYININSKIPDLICMWIFLLRPEDFTNIKDSIFYRNIDNHNNLWIKNLLESKSYSIIISRYIGKNTNHFELSTYKLLSTIYDNFELFDFGIRYLILNNSNLPQNEIEYLDSYIKSKSIIDYTFMHKFLLKTPEFVIKKIIQIEKLHNDSKYFRIGYEEKNFLIRYESNNLNNKSNYTNIILLYKIFVFDEVDEYEYNIFNLYLNKTNGIDKYEKVIFYEHLNEIILLVNYFINWANENINSWNKINENDLITYNYNDWIIKYFDGNINNYIKK